MKLVLPLKNGLRINLIDSNKKTSLRYRGKVIFEKVEMDCSFKRFPKLFQEDEACFLFMNQGG